VFFDNFYSACKQKNTTPNGVAKILGISSGSVTSWKNGTLPKSETLNKIAEHLEVSTDYLLGKENSLPPLSDREQELLDLFRQMSPEQQAAYVQIMKARK
jgi:transcriptional regulator with XRE-family HTH domain